jgi:glycosyltransferase involved in cell wall biosynthesis
LDRQKDPLLLVEAMRLVCKAEPQICVLLIGDGSLRHAVESRIDALNLRSHFRILGACAPVFVAEVLRAADLFVMSSAYEGMPIAVLEALASGVPVVTTDVGEVARVVRNGCNGEIVAVRTPEALADGVQNVLLHLDALRGAPCRQAVAPYSPERALSQIFEHHRGQAARRGLKRAGAT